MNRQAEEADRRADELINAMMQQNGNTSNETPEGQKQQDSKQAHEIANREDMIDIQKFNVLKGKYEAEVPRLHGQVKQLLNDLKNLEEDNRRLKEQSSNTASNQQTTTSEALDRLRNDFGDDLADTVMQLIRESNQPQQREPEQYRQQQQEPQQSRSAQYEFEQRKAEVTDIVGGIAEFNRIDNDSNFIEWLKEYDPKYGRIRHEAMNEFFSKGYAKETANFFITWRREQEEANPRERLEEFVQPNSVNTDGHAQEAKRTYMKSEWQGLWKTLQVDPRYRNSKEGIAEGEAIERELEAAAREGRVIR